VRVLVIDDEPDVQSVVARALKADGHAVTAADDLETARARVVDGTDLIVLDLRLPDGFGLELCRELRANGVTVPILVLTALSQVALRVEGLDAGSCAGPPRRAPPRPRVPPLGHRTRLRRAARQTSGKCRGNHRQRMGDLGTARAPRGPRGVALGSPRRGVGRSK
jgi:CheY-like chemotaxis protein